MDGRLWASVDASSTATGVAWWKGTELLRTELIRRKNSSGKEILNLAEAYSCLSTATVLVLEGGYVGKNKHTALVLGEERGAIKALAQSGGARIVVLQPAEWRPHVLTGWRNNMNRGQVKTIVRATARWLATPRPPRGSMWDGVVLPGFDKVSEDEQEATLLGFAWNLKGAAPKPKKAKKRAGATRRAS